MKIFNGKYTLFNAILFCWIEMLYPPICKKVGIGYIEERFVYGMMGRLISYG